MQESKAGLAVWSTPLEILLEQCACTRATCVIIQTFSGGDGESLAPDNQLFLTSFPYVTNLQKATVQVTYSYINYYVAMIINCPSA